MARWIDFAYVVPNYIAQDDWDELANDSKRPLNKAMLEAYITSKQAVVAAYALKQIQDPAIITAWTSATAPEILRHAIALLVVWQCYYRTGSMPGTVVAGYEEVMGENGKGGLLNAIAGGDIPLVDPAGEDVGGIALPRANRTLTGSLSLDKIRAEFPRRGAWNTFPEDEV